jgi:hypothetical protein
MCTCFDGFIGDQCETLGWCILYITYIVKQHVGVSTTVIVEGSVFLIIRANANQDSLVLDASTVHLDCGDQTVNSLALNV